MSGQELFYASKRGDAARVEELLRSPATDVNLEESGRECCSPLATACYHGHIKVVRHLLRHPGLDPNKTNMAGWTPLFLACRLKHPSIVLLLLRDPRVKLGDSKGGCRGHSVLHYACDEGFLEVVQALLSDGRVDINQACEHLQTPLYQACGRGHEDIVNLLLAQPHLDPMVPLADQRSALEIACARRHYGVIAALLGDPRVDPNLQDSCGTVLFKACMENQVTLVRLLLRNKRLDPNIGSNMFGTPLDAACRYGHVQVVELLLRDRRTDPNPQNLVSGKTPLAEACTTEHPACVRLLMARGIPVSELRTQFRTGGHARALLTPEILQVLEDYEHDPKAASSRYRKQLGGLFVFLFLTTRGHLASNRLFRFPSPSSLQKLGWCSLGAQLFVQLLMLESRFLVMP